MNNILSDESPQLVVINGDLITGENTYLANATHYVDQIVPPIVSRHLPWASTYGNHDSDVNLSPTALFQREKLWSNSLTQAMVADEVNGITNYYLPVYPSSGGSTPAMILWFFDSRSGKYFQTGAARPDYVSQAVVDWFQSTRDSLNAQYGSTIPSLAFVHIPTQSMLAFQQTGVSPTKEPGINDDIIGHQDGSDPYQGLDMPFMQALLNTQGLISVFSGHDHGDDWCFRWEGTLPTNNLQGNGLHQCFGRHTGYGGYGTWTRGSRQILVTESQLAQGAVQTWNRLEDSRIVGAVTLNSTYGQDDYPTVPDDSTGN